MRRWTGLAKFKKGDRVQTVVTVDAKQGATHAYKKGDIIRGVVTRVDNSASNPLYDEGKHLMPEPLFLVRVTSWNDKKHHGEMHCGGKWLKKI